MLGRVLHFQDTQMMSWRAKEEISSGLIMITSNCIHMCGRMQLLTVIHYIAVQCPFLSYSIIQQKMAIKISHWKDYLHQKDRNWRKAWKKRNLRQRRLKRKPEKVCQHVRMVCCFAAFPSLFFSFFFFLRCYRNICP